MPVRIFLLWLPMIVIAFLNAAIREGLLVKQLPLSAAHQLSTFLLIIFCSIYTWIIFSYLRINTPGQAIVAGTVWVILTILFEFALGFGTGKSFKEMLEQYNILRGNIWPLFLLAQFWMPYVVLRLK